MAGFLFVVVSLVVASSGVKLLEAVTAASQSSKTSTDPAASASSTVRMMRVVEIFVKRHCRTYVSLIIVLVWFIVRCSPSKQWFLPRLVATSLEIDLESSTSLLQWLVDQSTKTRNYILEELLFVSSANDSHYLPTVLFSWCWCLMEDLLGFLLIVSAYRVGYCLRHYSIGEWKESVTRFVFEWTLDNLPSFKREFDIQMEATFLKDGDSKLLHKDPHRTFTKTIPTTGRSRDAILQELSRYAVEEDKKWKDGKVSGTVYSDDTNHSEFMHSVYSLYSWGNPLHPGFWPKLNQCEAEVVCMTANLLNNPQNIGCVTSGGTESIILAIRAHLHYYGHRRRIAHPEIVCGSTAHAALWKACDMFGIRPVIIDCDDGATYQLNPSKVQSHITANTIMIYSSAPCYPQGVIDPIPELSEIAHAFDIGLHVDACLGGFILPFIDTNNDDDDGQNGGILPFDFRNRGVTSMSADTHKYGYAPKGTSVVLYGHKELRHGQYFCYPSWTGGMYSTPTIAGSRPGALSVCAWASLVSMGQQGYREKVQRIVQAARDMAKGVLSIKELQLMIPAPQLPTMIVCFGAAAANYSSSNSNNNPKRVIDIYRVGDYMTQLGWNLNSLQAPASIHVCVTLNMTSKVESFLNDLRAAVEQACQEGVAGKKQGTAGIYGAVGALPDGPTECVLRAFTDLTLEP